MSSPRFFDRQGVADHLGVSVKVLFDLRKEHPDFPKPVRLSARALRWYREEIDGWAEKQKDRERVQFASMDEAKELSLLPDRGEGLSR